jgi:hypothetical protein
VTFLSLHKAIRRSRVRPPGRQARRQPAGELALARGERFLLAVGIHIACALIAIVDRPTVSRRGWTAGANHR